MMSGTWHPEQGDDGILRVRIERADQPVNSLSRASLEELRELVSEIRSDTSIKGVIFRSGKSANCIAGADLKELKTLATKEAAYEISRLGQQVFDELESVSVPTLALISGACLGGGLEFAMACRFRVADDSPKTLLGLPEVQLGLIPGWGGTMRLPRLVGFLEALPMILTGRKLNPFQARSKGLIHDVVPTEALESVGEQIMAACRDRSDLDAVAKTLFRPKKKPLLQRMVADSGLVHRYAIRKARSQIGATTHGHYPAPLKALEVLAESRGRLPLVALQLEAAGIGEMAAHPVTAESMRLFFLQEGAKKAPHWLDADVDPKSIRQAGVIGAGAMGAGIALLFAKKGVHTRLKDIRPDFVGRGMKTIHELVSRDTKRRRITSVDATNILDRISPTIDYTGLKSADVVIEAVLEDIDIKRTVFDELAGATGPDTVLATNTSSLLVRDIARDVPHPERVVGLHFFNPPTKMPLVEIIRSDRTSPEALAAALAVVKRLGKTGVIVGDCAGFLVNRLLAPYMNEAGYLLLEAEDPMQIEKVAVDFGMPMGPLELTDLVGIPVAHHVVCNMHDAYGDRMKPAAFWDRLVQMAQPDSKGSLKVIDKIGGRKTIGNMIPGLVNRLRLDASITPRWISREEIVQRLIYPIVNEAAFCLEEGIASSADDVDLAMVFGTGFAPFRGGPMRYAQAEGLEQVVQRLSELAKQHARLAPGRPLQTAAECNSFDTIQHMEHVEVAV